MIAATGFAREWRRCRSTWFVFLLAAAGCASPLAPFHKNRALDATESKIPDELPPEQTAKVCLETAEQLERSGHYREAILLYEKARKNAPQAIDYSRRLAALYDRSGDAAGARREFEKALAQHPRDADLLNDFGYALYRQGDLSGAEQRLREAIDLRPDHPRAKMNLAVVLAEQDRLAESFDLFAQVSGPAAAHSNLGVILARRGRREEAVQAFQQAAALDPALSVPSAFLAYLHDRRSPELLEQTAFTGRRSY
jgi:Flp pilus assembly protein TadD